ncbi:hypothetical protein [Duganella vulcania]|uniref:Uncharacterized protein n=1 Tax=Duganella vulcania TaxID=2692166 RepID=A0A845GHN9_9BURK|nr:hypothetical protein [Duganella vulcania]MYM92826.1 hypothetical protein [Duganella vulcania]
MWARVVFGFDLDGLVVVKWREAFIWQNALEGEFSIGQEYVQELHRHTCVARLRVDGRDVLPRLADADARFAQGRIMNVSGISQREPWNSWYVQSWRMEFLSLDGRPPATSAEKENMSGAGVPDGNPPIFDAL